MTYLNRGAAPRAGALALLASLALAAPAPSRLLAHATLQSSVPSRGAYLTAAPRTLRLTFTEAPELQFTRVQLIGPEGSAVALGPLRLDSARTVVADILGALAAGT